MFYDNIKIKPKLIGTFLFIALVPLLAIGYLASRQSTSALERGEALSAEVIKAHVDSQLVSLRDSKRAAALQYFSGIKNQILTFSNNPMVVEAMTGFSKSFESFRSDSQIGDATLEQLKGELQTYYTAEFGAKYREMTGKDPAASEILSRLDPESIALQHRYIKSNPNPLGAKQLLDQPAGDSSPYAAAHKEYHPAIRDYLNKYGYYDVFLVSLETGDIVYTVFKEIDYSTSLVDGPFAETSLGEVFRKAKDAPESDVCFFEDFKSYKPSYEAPAFFVGSPIFDGDRKIGVAIFQLPTDGLNAVMSERSGLGETGETILVGPDYTMRSDSFRDPNHRTVAASFKDPETGKIKSDATTAALERGEEGIITTTDYVGNESIMAYAPLKIGDGEIVWCINAKMDVSEALAATQELKALSNQNRASLIQTTVFATLIVAIVIAVLAFIVSQKIANPIVMASGFANKIAEGDFTGSIVVQQKDEVGNLCTSLSGMARNLQETFAKSSQLSSMIENLPINVMFCDNDFTITYINPASARTLRTIEEHLPCSVDQIIGRSIDIFHRDPSHPRRVLANPNNLPHNALIQVGPEKLDLMVSSVRDVSGKGIGYQLTWSVVTTVKEVESQLTDAVERLQNSAITLKEVSTSMAAAAEQTSNQSAVVSSAAEQVNANMSTVASAAEEMTSSIKEISTNASEAARVSQEAVSVANITNETINSLGERSEEIGNVIKVISSIAQQTNLLALNATIEAARAGEAGKGFAVVANEVKELAKQTAGATDDITVKIEAIQAATNDAVRAIGEITGVIGTINDISNTIASAVEEQAATTNEISRNVTESATGAQEIAQNITGVATAANETACGANQNLSAADNLANLATELGNLLGRMRTEAKV